MYSLLRQGYCNASGFILSLSGSDGKGQSPYSPSSSKQIKFNLFCKARVLYGSQGGLILYGGGSFLYSGGSWRPGNPSLFQSTVPQAFVLIIFSQMEKGEIWKGGFQGAGEFENIENNIPSPFQLTKGGLRGEGDNFSF